MTLRAEQFLANLAAGPGVYQMLDQAGKIIYVGKAKNLQKRVGSYFSGKPKDTKTLQLLKQIDDIKVIITRTENEALLLENSLIKQYKPRYNVLLKDDKSYPYIYLSAHEDFPRLDFYRGSRKTKGQYFGPFPSAHAVRETLTLLQRIFKLRQCRDTFFHNRTRPCLQYQIKRCTAPCVNYISAEDYLNNVKLAVLFLKGKNDALIHELVTQMEESAGKQEYEQAARFRDQIALLRKFAERNQVTKQGDDFDAVTILRKSGEVCIVVLTLRAGRLIGSQAFFPKTPAEVDLQEALAAFLPQYYLNSVRQDSLPRRVYLNEEVSDRQWLENAFQEHTTHKITLITQPKSKENHWLQLAMSNAEQALRNHLLNKHHNYQRFEALQTALQLPNLPEKLECFDISHTMGEATVASCVVFDLRGPVNQDYRRFNIKDITPGDDYAAMHQVLLRRYTRIKEEGKDLPDLIIIDGGKGQLAQAEAVLEEIQVSGVILLSIAKGPSRKPGLENIFISGRTQPIHLEPDNAGFHLIQHIRDEAHRFAITGHRAQRGKRRRTSILESIPGVGPKRRQELLRQFGGLQSLKAASVEQISRVPGINIKLAQVIFDALKSST